MKTTRILKNDVNYLLFNELYMRFSDSKAKYKAFTILECTIQCLSRRGFNNITLQMVAKEAGISRPLITYYFLDLEELTSLSLKYIRLLFQKLVVEAMATANSEDLMLTNYLDACFHWVEKSRVHALVWLSFLHECTRRPTARKLNSAAVEIGTDRLKQLLILGKEKKIFSFISEDMTARSIQALISGALISYVTENLNHKDQYKINIKKQCFYLCGLNDLSSK